MRGYALGGGLELAMSCDMIVLGDDARLGQPEIRIGILPGSGGTQRLTRAIGQARAMEMILTGRTIDAAEADRAGLVTRVVPAAETLDAALDLAATIASMPPLAVRAAKDAVRQAAELPLSAGLRHERQLLYLLFATEDRTEGMRAFLEKRPPAWQRPVTMNLSSAPEHVWSAAAGIVMPVILPIGAAGTDASIRGPVVPGRRPAAATCRSGGRGRWASTSPSPSPRSGSTSS